MGDGQQQHSHAQLHSLHRFPYQSFNTATCQSIPNLEVAMYTSLKEKVKRVRVNTRATKAKANTPKAKDVAAGDTCIGMNPTFQQPNASATTIKLALRSTTATPLWTPPQMTPHQSGPIPLYDPRHLPHIRSMATTPRYRSSAVQRIQIQINITTAISMAGTSYIQDPNAA